MLTPSFLWSCKFSIFRPISPPNASHSGGPTSLKLDSITFVPRSLDFSIQMSVYFRLQNSWCFWSQFVGKMNAKWEYDQLSFSEPFMRFTFRRNLGVPVIAKWRLDSQYAFRSRGLGREDWDATVFPVRSGKMAKIAGIFNICFRRKNSSTRFMHLRPKLRKKSLPFAQSGTLFPICL